MAQRMAAEDPLLRAMRLATEQNPWTVVALIRLSYIPDGLKTVALSTFPISLRDHTIIAMLCNLPYCMAEVRPAASCARDAPSRALQSPALSWGDSGRCGRDGVWIGFCG